MSVRETSLEALQYIKESGVMGKLRLDVYEYIVRNPGCIQDDFLAHFTSLRPEGINTSSYTGRLGELEKGGFIKPVGKKRGKSGRNQIMWESTDVIPTQPMTEKQLLESLGCETRDDYYFTEHWVDFKDGYYTRHPRVCYISGVTTRLHLHHITYERLGAELDEDVVPLHEFWHKVVHHLVKEHKVKLEIAHKVAKVVYQATGKWEEINL